MENKTLFRAAFIVSLLALGAGCSQSEKKSADTSSSEKIATKKASTFPASVHNPMPGEIIVKCAGIAKKGKNHCGANGHSCNGLSAKDPKIKDFDKNEWVYVRKEVCDATPGRIVGKKKVVEG